MISVEYPDLWKNRVIPWAEVSAVAGDKCIADCLANHRSSAKEFEVSIPGTTAESKRKHNLLGKKWVNLPPFTSRIFYFSIMPILLCRRHQKENTLFSHYAKMYMEQLSTTPLCHLVLGEPYMKDSTGGLLKG